MDVLLRLPGSLKDLQRIPVLLRNTQRLLNHAEKVVRCEHDLICVKGQSEVKKHPYSFLEKSGVPKAYQLVLGL